MLVLVSSKDGAQICVQREREGWVAVLLTGLLLVLARLLFVLRHTLRHTLLNYQSCLRREFEAPPRWRAEITLFAVLARLQ